MKLGLVVEGGGMKCAYTAGILDRMMDDEIHPDYAIGVSAGAACAASFAAGQRDRNRRFFVDYVADPLYMGFSALTKSGNFFNLEYIYNDMTAEEGKDPLDYDAIMRNPMELWAVATDAETGLPHYFTKRDMDVNDYRVYMASCAIPVVCQPVKIGKHCYYDGGCSDALPVKRALESGCDRLLIILCRPKTIVRTPEAHRAIYHASLSKYPKIVHDLDVRHIRYNRTLEAARKLEGEGRALIIAPEEELQVNTYTKDPSELQRLYDQAVIQYDDIREKIAEFCR